MNPGIGGPAQFIYCDAALPLEAIPDDEALEMTRRLASEEGIYSKADDRQRHRHVDGGSWWQQLLGEHEGSLDEELAKQRQELPWVTVEKEYTIDTEEGKKTLACSDLVLRHGLPLPWVSQMGPVGGSKLIARRKVAHARGAAVEVA